MNNRDTVNESEQPSIEEYSPDALMQIFSKSRVGLSLVAALAVHLVVIAVLSVPMYLLGGDTADADSDQPQQQTDGETEGEAGDEQAGEGDGADGEDDGATGEGEGGEGGEGDAEGAGDEQGAGEDAEGDGEAGEGEDGMTPVERRTSEAADPDEVPEDPDDLLIPLDQTNP